MDDTLRQRQRPRAHIDAHPQLARGGQDGPPPRRGTHAALDRLVFTAGPSFTRTHPDVSRVEVPLLHVSCAQAIARQASHGWAASTHHCRTVWAAPSNAPQRPGGRRASGHDLLPYGCCVTCPRLRGRMQAADDFVRLLRRTSGNLTPGLVCTPAFPWRYRLQRARPRGLRGSQQWLRAEVGSSPAQDALCGSLSTPFALVLHLPGRV